MHTRSYYRSRLRRDLGIVVLSIAGAVLIVRLGVLGEFLARTEEIQILASFIAGLFFTSAFTIAPAAIALGELAEHISPYTIALFGACGALVGDLLIFFFIRDAFAADLMGTLHRSSFKRFLAHLHLGLLRWVALFLGGLIIASPLPDELGLAFMGLSRTRVAVIIPISFLFNFVGILLITLAARAIHLGVL